MMLPGVRFQSVENAGAYAVREGDQIIGVAQTDQMTGCLINGFLIQSVDEEGKKFKEPFGGGSQHDPADGFRFADQMHMIFDPSPAALSERAASGRLSR